MQEGYWVTRTYQSGAVGEKTKFFVPGTRPTGKLNRRAKDAVRKQEQNEYSAQKALQQGTLFPELDLPFEGRRRGWK